MFEPTATTIALLVLVGLAGFVVVGTALLLRLLHWLVIVPWRLLTRPGGMSDVGDPSCCPHADCGHANRPGAVFCARCGRRLGG